MTTYYVGKGGNDGNDGLSWANRFLTLNGAEDEPVASGDTVYVGPGIYREMLVCDVDGVSEIKYIADVTGVNTDGVGGDVIVSGSDGDTTATRNRCISANANRSYRTFIGFHFVGYANEAIYFISSDNLNIIDCSFSGGNGTATQGIQLYSTYNTVNIERCHFVGMNRGVNIDHSSDQSATSFTVSDCVMCNCYYGVWINNVDSIVVENCTMIATFGMDVNSLAGSTSVTARNCVLFCTSQGFNASAAGEIASTYCQVTANANQNWTAGTGDVEDYVMNLQLPILIGNDTGIRFPVPLIGQLNPYAYAGAVTGSSETTEDLFGITKPTTTAKSSWGAIQFQCPERETGTTRGGSTASIGFEDAGEHQIWVPVTGIEVTIAVYCYREANYAGTNPTMVIKQPGQADRTTTDAAAASQWNQLTDTFTPDSDTDYVVVCLQSLNTAAAGNYAAFFDDLTVT